MLRIDKNTTFQVFEEKIIRNDIYIYKLFVTSWRSFCFLFLFKWYNFFTIIVNDKKIRP